MTKSWPPPCARCGGPQTGWTTLFCAKDCSPTPIVTIHSPASCEHTNTYISMGLRWCLACGAFQGMP